MTERVTIRMLVVVAGLWVSTKTWSGTTIYAPSNTASLNALAAQTADRLKTAGITTEITGSKEDIARICSDRDNALVTLGPYAYDTVPDGCLAALFPALITGTQLMSKALPARGGALLLNAPNDMTLCLAKAALHNSNRRLLFVTTDWIEAARVQAMAPHSIAVLVTTPEALVGSLQDRALTGDGIIIDSSTRLVSAHNMRHLMVVSTEKRLPIFGGLTKEYIDAGYAGVVYSDTDTLGEEVLQLLKAFKRSPQFTVRHSQNWSAAINPRARAAFGLTPKMTDDVLRKVVNDCTN